ncbi:MAG: hypothetical protein ACJ8FZ_03235 [Bradyrhizobium sp.]
MNAFSYLSVLLSMVIGLGLTQLLTVFGRMIRHRGHVRFDWVPLLWAVVLLVNFVQVWWSLFGLRSHPEWSFLEFLIVLTQTAALYLMAAVALPEQIDGRDVDLFAHYDRHRRWFFSFLLATLALSIVRQVAINGSFPDPDNLGFQLFLAATAIAAMIVRARRVQEAVAVVAAATLATYIGVLFAHLR